MERLDSTGDNACTVCHDTMHIIAVGHCDHPVCYKCSTRMRVLCEQMDCPICRSAMPQVAFVYDKVPFKDIDLRRCIPNRKNKIFYETEEIEDMYLDLLEFRCHECPKRKPERTFSQLQTHMRREHQLFACDICLEHLKIFPYETKFYDRKSLAVHRRVGDKDDKSYKGHPLCEFCDARYLDKDELMKHLRKDHFFCHFCDQQGSNAYYNDYPDLVVHFEESHFLCTEDECGSPTTRFTHAFASEIDLKSHKATVHNMNSREMRTIQVDFQFAPRHQGYSRGSGLSSDDYEDSGTYRHRSRNDRYGNRRRQHDDPNLQKALEESLQERPPVEERVPDPIQDFPTLGGLPAPQIQQKSAPKAPKEDFPSLGASNKAQKAATGMHGDDFPKLGSSNNKTQKGMAGSGPRDNDFPGLSSSKAKAQKTVPVVSNRGEDFPGLGSSKAKAHKSVAGVSKREEDFPGLGTAKGKAPNAANVSVSKHDDFPGLGSSKAKAQKTGVMKNEEDFPTLGASKSQGSKNYAAMTHSTSDTIRPVVKKEKPRDSQPVSLGSVKHMNKDRWTSQTPEEDDYPCLASKSNSRAKSAAGDNSSSSWLQKSSVTEIPQSTSATPTVSFISEKPTESSESQSKKQAPKVKPFTDDDDFPSLGGGTTRQPSVPGNITWSKPKSNSNNKKQPNPKHDRSDNGYFDPPDSNKSNKPASESYKANNKSNSSNESPKKNINMSKKDFPSLSKGDSTTKQPSNKKQVKGSEIKKVDSKPVDAGSNKNKKSKKGHVEKSLNDIASGLMDVGISNSKQKEKKINATDENGNKPKLNKNVSNVKSSRPNSSNNSPVLKDSMVAVEVLDKELVQVQATNSNNSFPSLHAMSSSVQDTNAPPGFAPTSFQVQQPLHISAPPGFSKPAPPGLTEPTISQYNYIQPADFTNRNQVLVQTIRSCLDTVEDGFDKFKAFSFQFRQGNINASAYYTNCLLLIGEFDFKEIFPELLALLPDINKQQELWFEHQVVVSGRPISTGLRGGDCLKNLSPCSKCCQVVLTADLQHHNLQHGGDVADFPSLKDVSRKGANNGASAHGPLKGAWIKTTT